MKRMLKDLRLKFGSSEAKPSLEFGLGPVTVFVGPNNSGKSLALREIESFISQGHQHNLAIVSDIGLRILAREDAEELIASRTVEKSSVDNVPPEGHIIISRIDPVSGSVGEAFLHVDRLLGQIDLMQSDGHGDLSYMFQNLISLFVVRLDGRTRFGLTEPKPAADLLGLPHNHLLALFQDENARKRMREITFEAFGLYFVIDPTNVGTLRVRMSEKLPEDTSEEQSWDERARKFHGQAANISDLSDGVKAFTGLTAAVLSGDYRVMLVDEPEAFLHPVLARQLGSKLTELASEREGNVLASTHSPDFLMGCIQAGEGTNVVRLTYKGGVPTARHLSAERLRQITRDPLLRSTGILGGLFHEGVVVSEDDADRALYQEVNHHLLTANLGGANNTLYLNAQNKQTLRKIVAPLREMGIPAATIVDLDIIKSRDFNDLLKAANVPESQIDAWNVQRSRVNDMFQNAGLDMKKGGLDLLNDQDKESAQNLLDGVAQYGIFVVPIGELEYWFAGTRRLPERPGKRLGPLDL